MIAEGIDPMWKWPGGKRLLGEKIRRIYDAPPPKRFVEVCVGGGAVFLARRAIGELTGKEVVLVDAEARLMASYRGVQHAHDAVLGAMEALPWGKPWRDSYEGLRERFNAWTPDAAHVASPAETALMLWINRAGFNGLYRVNQAGRFNVPPASYVTLARPSRKEMATFAEALVGVELVTASADDYIDAHVGEGDQLYGDSPYFKQFDAYTSARFPWSMHVSLAQATAQASSRGAFVVLSNSNTPETMELYLGLGFDVRGVLANRSIAASGEKRKKAKELLVIGRPHALEVAAPRPSPRRREAAR